MSKFKVGDVVLCLKRSGVVAEGYQYQVTSISPCGCFVRVDGNDSGDLDINFQLVEPVDELPPAPESVQYMEEASAVGTFGHLLVQPSIEGPSLYIEVYAEQYSSGKSACTGIRIEPDAALQLCHDLRRMAMSIKRKEKHND
ncbi:hypothetical protein BI050_gp10 [Pectobacterium phage PP90]|uniref:Uncharacterized protein n=1 Tax=Pectobacterium phage PP90 TaxID=1873959 RepID=A0A1B1PEH2_9CAUD|nr:hypothetical protein BI050_gp10 [Pectobacterium phage PP90]ANT45367.1 hypothetical protein BI050_gp10 [Pectobacterium phage PP90]